MLDVRHALVVLPVVLASAAHPASPPCRPCAGLEVDDPAAVLERLEPPPVVALPARLYLAWQAELDGSAPRTDPATFDRVGTTPWTTIVFRTPSPLLEHEEGLQSELEEAARIAAAAGPRAHFQIDWRGGPDWQVGEYAFLFKRAAVALRGANEGARVVTQGLTPDEGLLDRLYAEELGAYLDGVALTPTSETAFEAAVEHLARLDPGKPAVVDSLPYPTPAALALARAARFTELGAGVVLFSDPGGRAELAPLKLLATEFQGDLSFDPYSTPSGGRAAWSFVRGEDLGLRVLVESEATDELVVRFSDRQLKAPARIDPETGEAIPLYAARRDEEGLTVTIADPEPVTLLRLERLTASEIEGLEGLEESVTVTSDRDLPVEEILRRLQSFEDAQYRRLDHYQATNTTHLRFQIGAGIQTVETTFEGDFFFRQGEGFDWAWQTLYVNGVRWRSKKLPEIPLIQPEKATALPLEIHLSKEYAYRLRGTETVDGRDCWVVEFGPRETVEAAAVGEEAKLYEGSVWIDREIFARVRTRARQLGLAGEVLSNEEVVSYSPVDADGQPADWSPTSYFLPLKVIGQQLLSIVNATTVVEKETILSAVRINGSDFDGRLDAVHSSEVTMVRDTDDGMRYLVKDKESGERTVKEGYDTTKLFALGGVFLDDALDYPLPLAGVNYLSLDFKGSGNQVNAFFAGPLLLANIADPRFRESKFDLGAQAFALAFPIAEEVFADGEELPGEEVEFFTGFLELNVGRPIGSFVKVNAFYDAFILNYRRSDNTDDAFRLPADHVTHSFGLRSRVARNGYGLLLEGTYNRRSKWTDWGFEGNPEFDDSKKDYFLWEAALSKTWYLPKFQKIGLELNYLDGTDLDRFSKYEFGFFAGTRVHGFQSNKVRAEEALAAHLTYGFDIGKVFRIEAIADAAWATDRINGLDRELLAGVGINGTFIGPWRTVVNLDVGVPVEGPDDGFVLYLVFLKLIDR